MQSIKTRFNGNAQEVIDYTRIWGRQKAMRMVEEKYGIKDYLCFSKFLEAETGNPNFGLCPTLGGTGNNSWAEDLLDAFISKIRQMEAERERLQTELKRLTLDLEYYKGQQALKIEPKVHQLITECLGFRE